MPKEKPSFSHIKTVREWNDSIGTNAAELFYCLSQALVTLGKKEWDELFGRLARNVFEKAVEEGRAERIWALIWLSLAEASFDLTRELALWLSWADPEDSKRIVTGLDLSFEDCQLTIDSDLLGAPGDIGILEWVKKPFVEWLTGQGLEAGRAGPAVERLNVYFKFVYYRRLLNRAADQAPAGFFPDLQIITDDPMDLYWESYFAGLEKNTRRPYYSEDTFDTSQVYAPQRAYRLHPVVEDDHYHDLNVFLRRKNKGLVKEVVDLEEALISWLNDPDNDESICLISTSGNSGEGTFNSFFASRTAQRGRVKPLLIPLKEWDSSADAETELERFLVGSGRFPKNPVIDPDVSFLLIFEKISTMTTNLHELSYCIGQLFSQIDALIKLYNNNGRRMTVVVTGFSALIEAVEKHFLRKERRKGFVPVYIPLPLVVTDQDQVDYYDPKNLLEEDQREEWWRRYGRVTGKNYQGAPDELRRLKGNFKKLTANPTYNYLAACAWERKSLELSENTARSELAFDRFMFTYNRVYNPQKPYKWLFEISPSSYRHVIKEIAALYWHGGKKPLQLEKSAERIQRSGLASQLNAITELAQVGALSFLNYQTDSDGKGCLTFPYRGLPNYLTARRVYNELQAIQEGLEQQEGFAFMGLDDEAALRRWAALCGPVSFTHQMLHFFMDIIQVGAVDYAETWQDMTIRLLSWIEKFGLPLNDLGGASNKVADWARNAEEALLICHYACARVTMRQGRIKWRRDTSAGDWLRRLIRQRIEGLDHLTLGCLAFLDFSNCTLNGIDLSGGNLNQSFFKQSHLHHSCLSGADLTGADLTGASLQYSNLAAANLGQTYMRKADLCYSNLKWVDLQQADLSGSLMIEAVLRGADLRWVDLRGADLRKADLRGCDLKWAYLEDTDLRGADLRGADLRETDLSRVRLDGADLTWADLDIKR